MTVQLNEPVTVWVTVGASDSVGVPVPDGDRDRPVRVADFVQVAVRVTVGEQLSVLVGYCDRVASDAVSLTECVENVGVTVPVPWDGVQVAVTDGCGVAVRVGEGLKVWVCVTVEGVKEARERVRLGKEGV